MQHSGCRMIGEASERAVVTDDVVIGLEIILRRTNLRRIGHELVENESLILRRHTSFKIRRLTRSVRYGNEMHLVVTFKGYRRTFQMRGLIVDLDTTVAEA
jgi:hypothetical protein